MPRHFGRKFVPSSTITARMDRKDARVQAAARRTAGVLAPDVVSYASVVTIPAGATICAWCPDFRPTVVGTSHGMCAACFHRFLSDPSTGARLDAMLADNARIDAQLREDDRLEDLREAGGDGEACGRSCGYCGRCS